MVNKKYSFASLSLEFESEVSIADEKYFPLFCGEEIQPQKRFYVKESELPEKQGKLVYTNNLTSLYETEKGKLLFSSYPSSKTTSRDYACLEITPEGGTVSVAPGEKLRDSTLMKAVNIHGLLLEKGCALFHCSFIITQGEAILFTGKSGIGKTTQARLWEKHRGALIVNDDRAALTFNNGRLYAVGTPFCGSSDIALKESAPVRAIVTLEQGKENRAEKPQTIQSFASVLSGITYEPRDKDENMRAFSIAEKTVKSTDLLKLTCTADERAVEALEKLL